MKIRQFNKSKRKWNCGNRIKNSLNILIGFDQGRRYCMYINIKSGDIVNGARVYSLGLALNPDVRLINLDNGCFAYPDIVRIFEKKTKDDGVQRSIPLPIAAGDYVNGKKIEEIIKMSVKEEEDCAILENGDRIFMTEIKTYKRGEK